MTVSPHHYGPEWLQTPHAQVPREELAQAKSGMSMLGSYPTGCINGQPILFSFRSMAKFADCLPNLLYAMCSMYVTEYFRPNNTWLSRASLLNTP